MKKYLYLLALGLSTSTLLAQQITDALRFAQTDLNGTARFRSMSGAFGALGGDLSSLSINPAGSAIYNHNEFGFTLSNQNTQNTSTYFGTPTTTTDNHFDFSQIGTVWVFNNYDQGSDWKKISFAINYDNQKNFNNSMFTRGINPNHSIADYFISYANGIPLSNISGNNSNFPNLSYNEQQAYLGYNGYIINPTSNNQYVSNLANTNNFYHENIVNSYGYNGKLAFNLASSYQDKIYFGLNLNSHFTDYRSHTSFYEDYLNASGSNPGSQNNITSSRLDNYLHTYGSGFSFQLGAIAKVTKEIRLGFTYESPTWYHLYDELQQNYYVNCPDCGTKGNPGYIDPGVTMLYPQYTIETPSKYSPSFAYIFNKKGVFSLDYVLKDYSKTTLKPENQFIGPNQAMASMLSSTNEIRAGAEYRIDKFSLRGGYRYVESPYRDKQTIGDLNSYSGGFGYNFGPAKFDFSYTHIQQNSQQAFFTQGLTDPSYVKTRFNNVAFTLTFPF